MMRFRLTALFLAGMFCSIGSAQGIMTTGGLRVRIVPPNRSVLELAAGSQHSAAVMDDGSIAAWGRNLDGQSLPPALSQPAIQIACGRNHTVALLEDGSIQAWGSNLYGQSESLSGPFTAIATGAEHTLALRPDGSVTAIGDDLFGQSSPPFGITFTMIAAGGYTSYGLDTDGEIHVWGFDGFDLNLPPEGPFTDLACGHFHALALRASGSVASWGLDSNGQTQPPATNYIAIDAYGNTSGGITSGGDVLLWGQFGADSLIEVPPGPFSDLTLGGAHALAMRADGSYAAWGSDLYGQSTTYFGGYERVRCSLQAVAALRTEDRQLVGWGKPLAGGEEWKIVKYPVDEPCDESYDTYCRLNTFEIAWGTGMMVAEAGGRWCWNMSDDAFPPGCPGQVNGVFPTDLSFGAIHRVGLYPGLGVFGGIGFDGFDGDYVAFAAGLEHVVAVAADGTVSCAGDTYHGQCTPPEDLPADLVGIAAGETFTVGLRTDGSLIGWGGLLGGENPYVGVEVTETPVGTDFIDVTAGNRHGLGLTASGSVIGWGIDEAGQYDFPENLRASAFDATGSTSAVILDPDCDLDGIVDAWAIRDGLVPDCNGNGIPDACDEANGRPVLESCPCTGDFDGDGLVGGSDLSQLLAVWDLSGNEAREWDLTGDELIDGSDLTVLLSSWGTCPSW